MYIGDAHSVRRVKFLHFSRSVTSRVMSVWFLSPGQLLHDRRPGLEISNRDVQTHYCKLQSKVINDTLAYISFGWFVFIKKSVWPKECFARYILIFFELLYLAALMDRARHTELLTVEELCNVVCVLMRISDPFLRSPCFLWLQEASSKRHTSGWGWVSTDHDLVNWTFKTWSPAADTNRTKPTTTRTELINEQNCFSHALGQKNRNTSICMNGSRCMVLPIVTCDMYIVKRCLTKDLNIY